MKKLISIALLTLSTASYANVWDELKHQPATQFDIGRVQLEVGAQHLTEKWEGERVGKSKFEIKQVSVIDDANKLGMKITYSARAKYIDNGNCQYLQSVTAKLLPTDKVVKNIWKGLSESQYQKLEQSFPIETEQTSSSGNALTVSCN